MTKSGGAVHAFRPLRNSTTKATDHALQKYDNFTRYGQSGALRTRVPDAAQRLFGGAPQTRDPPTPWTPDQQRTTPQSAARRAASGERRKGFVSCRKQKNGAKHCAISWEEE